MRQRLLEVLEELGFPPFDPSHVEASLSATNDGGFFGVHNDNGHALLHSRRLTFVYYLYREPQGFQGGDLRLYETRFSDGRYLAPPTALSGSPQFVTGSCSSPACSSIKSWR